jgi:ATP-dependent Clp protease ATP-binding subunit ClpA
MSPTTPPLAAALIARLAHAGVRVDVRDDDTAVFHGLPTDGRVFTKPRTNLLLVRPGSGLPYLVAVDEDLEYTGDDPALQRAFAAARREHGWRVLPVGRTRQRQLQPALEEALELLGNAVAGDEEASQAGFGSPGAGREETFQPGSGSSGAGSEEASRSVAGSPEARGENPAPPGLLDRVGTDLIAAHAAGRGETTVGRAEELQRLQAALGQLRAGVPVIVGPAGVGKTNLLHGLAPRLLEDPPRRLVAVDLGDLFAGHVFHAERENVLRALLDEARQPSLVLALEHLELVFLEAPHGPLLLEAALERGVRIVATALPGIALLADDGSLGGRLESISLAEPGPQATALVLREVSRRVGAHHGVAIDEDAIALVIDQALPLPGHLPGKAVTLLDRATSRAAMLGDQRLDEVHVHLAAAP